MSRLIFGDTPAQVTAAFDDRMKEIVKQHKVLVTAAFPAFVSMARLQPGESVLDAKCSDGELLAEIVTAVGGPTGMTLGLDDDADLLRSASQFLRSKSLKQYTRLFKASLLNHDANTITQALTEKNLPTTFNTIFAVDCLPPSPSDRVTMLRLLASRLTTTSGRMVVTFRHADGTLGEIAGAVRFDDQNNVYYRTSWMLESEWARAETEVRGLAARAGLRVTEMRRVGFDGAEAQLWDDDSARVDLLTRQSLADTHTNAQGNPTVAFKNAKKHHLTNMYNDGIVAISDEDVLVGACLVAVLVL